MKTYGLLLLFAIVLINACQNKDINNNKTVFRYNEASGISSLDPAYAKNLANIWACNQLFNGLVELDSNLKIKPAIAKSWTISDDGLTYIFNLRDDVFFHDHPIFPDSNGRKVNAKDFEYSFKRILSGNTVSPGAWIFNYVEENNGVPAFNAINDSIFEIRLKQSFPPFLSMLTMKYSSVVPKEIVEYYGSDFRRNPLGTGPFKFKIWKEDNKLVFVKNKNYFEYHNNKRLPFIDAVAISFLKDKQSAFLEFIKGNLEFMSGIDPNYKDELLTKNGKLNPKYKGRFKLLTAPYLNTEYLGILIDTTLEEVKASPLQNKYIRKAINYGFNRKKMIRYLRNNIGIPGNYGIIPPGLPSFDSAKMKGYYYNPGKARHYLSLASYSDGEGLPEITLNTTAEYLDLCKYIQHQLSELGIDIAINVNPPGALKEMKAQAKLNFFRASWIADYPDAENYLSLFYGENFCPAGPNYTHFKLKKFDKLFLKVQETIDDKQKFDLYSQMNNLVMQKSPVVILYYDQVLRFIQYNVKDLGINPVNLLDLRYVKIIND